MTYLRTAATLLYLVMALWLLAAGVRRIALQLSGASAPDFAAYTSASLGLCALLVFAAAAFITRRGTAARLPRD